MKKNLLFFSLLTSCLYGQVGINTLEPKATLDVNGNLIVREASELVILTPNHRVLIRDHSSDGDYEIKEADVEAVLNYSLNRNATIYSAKRNGNWQLLSLSLGESWYPIGLTGATDTRVGEPTLFENGVYTAIESGIYTVQFEVQLQVGVDINLLGGKSLGIFKNSIVWERKFFDAVRVSLLGVTLSAVPVTSTEIVTIVQLEVGDTLTFAVHTDGLLPTSLGLLSNATANLQVYKISN